MTWRRKRKKKRQEETSKKINWLKSASELALPPFWTGVKIIDEHVPYVLFGF